MTSTSYLATTTRGCPEEVDASLKAMGNGDPDVTSLEKVTVEAEDYNKARQQLHETHLQIERIRQTEGEIRERKEQLDRLQAPDQDTLTNLEQLSTKHLQLQTQLESALLHIELRPTEQRRVEVLKGEPVGLKQLAGGESLRVNGSPSIEMELEGFGFLKVTGPSQSATELQKKLTEVTERIQAGSSKLGTTDISELSRRRQQAIALEAQISTAEQVRRTLLAGRTLPSLEGDAAKPQRKVAAAESLHLEWKETPPDVMALKRQLASARQAFEERRSAITAEWKQRQGCLSDARTARVGHESELDHLTKQSASDQAQLSKLRVDGLSDLERSQRRTDLCVEVRGLEESYRQELARLQNLGADPRPNLERAHKEEESADQAFHKAEKTLYEHRGTLKKLLAKAPYEQSATLEEEIKQISGEIERDRSRADAFKLLRDTINECEEEATAGVAEPVAERATRLLHRIAGKGLGPIALSEDLAPWTVEPSEAEDTVELEALSGGEREQIYLSVRLAVAELLTKDSGRRELVVLDDVLTASDDKRLERALKILAEMSTHAQLLILTCHPERYKALKNATFADIATLRS